MMDAVENSVLWEISRDIMEELSDANGDIVLCGLACSHLFVQ